MHKLLLILVTLLLFITPAKANKGIIEYIKNPKLVGQASYNYIFWHVYDVYLYAENVLYSSDKPFALMLIYKRDLEGNDIALRSKQEIQKIGEENDPDFGKWFSEKTLYPKLNKQLLGSE